MLEILSGKKTGKAIVTLAIGNHYLEKWKVHAMPNLLEYCKKYEIGLYVQTSSLDTKKVRKKPQWQKLLLPSALKAEHSYIKEFCYIDTDILVNPFADSVFSKNSNSKLSFVSQFNNLPFDLELILRRIAFNRHHFYSKDYPLDSSLFMRIKEIYDHHDLPQKSDYGCTGFFMGFVDNCEKVMTDIYNRYDHNVSTLTDGGDEPILNFEFQENFDINWLAYKYQAIWLYEMASYYPFLYENGDDKKLITECIDASLSNNIFLHFAGSWHESSMFELGSSLLPNVGKKRAFYQYKNQILSRKPVGVIKPNHLGKS